MQQVQVLYIFNLLYCFDLINFFLNFVGTQAVRSNRGGTTVSTTSSTGGSRIVGFSMSDGTRTSTRIERDGLYFFNIKIVLKVSTMHLKKNAYLI